MQCPKCGSNNCQIITETSTEGKDFSASQGCCGWLQFYERLHMRSALAVQEYFRILICISQLT